MSEQTPCQDCGKHEPELEAVPQPEITPLEIEKPAEFIIKNFVVKEPETVKPEGLNVEVIL